MSFAATLALIAGYERGAIKLRGRADTSLGARAALWGVNEIVGLAIASLLAGLATTPYAAFHFHRVTPYGVVANLLAMPIVSAWVMPMGILGILTMPLGLDAEFWRQMGYGIEWMNAVGLWVASLPGAYGRVNLFGTGPLLLATAGFLFIGLLKTPLRWSGAVVVVAAALWAGSAPRPDVLIAADGRGFAVRGNDGRLAIHHTGDSFAVREWLAADADGRGAHDQSLGQGIACDPSGCIGKLVGGGLVAYALTPGAFEEDCARAALVIASRGDPPADCKATVIDRTLWRQRGALTLSRRGSDFAIESARPRNFDRPWSPAPVPRQARAATLGESGQAEIGGRARDATPRQEDIEADQ
jgi:competence protein ComEC